MEDTKQAYEDMQFFEHRLTEVISGMQPRVNKWRIVIAIVFFCTVYSAYFWIVDPSIRYITLWESLAKHPFFTFSISVLLFLFVVCGGHKKMVAPRLIAIRCQSVLADFCLSCDENGKLIVRPAYSPTSPSSSSSMMKLEMNSSRTMRILHPTSLAVMESSEETGFADDSNLLGGAS